MKTEPIRNKEDLKALADYFLQKGQLRNYVLVILGVHTALRIGDLLQLQWQQVYNEKNQVFLSHITITEKKTGKTRKIAMNPKVLEALRQYFPYRRGRFIFANNRKNARPISRVQAWRLLSDAASEIGLTEKISCHSLRKTFGYCAWTSGNVSPAVIMEIYQHADYQTTRAYLGIVQDDLDEVYLNMNLF